MSEDVEKWPEAKKALWRVLMDERLNDGHYIKAFDLVEKLYAAIQTASLAQCTGASVEEIARIIDPTAHEMYDAAYAAKDGSGQMVWIMRLKKSREKASNILFRLNPPPAITDALTPAETESVVRKPNG